MSQIQKVRMCSASSLVDGAALKIEMADRPPLAVFNLGGEFFVIDDTCTHGDASLSEGEVFGDDIICPFHSGTFCIRTGEATSYPAVRPVRVYRTSVEGDDVLAEIDVDETQAGLSS